jgi:glycine/D-amino acid oxidase-like deaminating enzyme
MNRDGAMKSLWQDGMPEYSSKIQKEEGKVYDVLIVGGGITGITTALLLQKEGLSCIVAEAKNLCFGTTGGTTAHLNSFLDTDYNTIKNDFGKDNARLVHMAASQALELFKQHVKEYNLDCGYEEKDGYVYAQDEKQVSQLNDIYQSSLDAGAEVEFADRIPVHIPFKKAIVYRRQAQIHPARYVYALAKAFEEAGGVIVQNCRTGHTHGKGPFRVESEQGDIHCNHIIFATHIPPGVNLLHFRCAPYRSYAMAVRLADDNYPDGLAYDMYDPYHYYRSQEIDGKKYLIVGGEDHKTGHEENTDKCFLQLEAHVRKYFNVKEVAFKWSSQYFEPADGLAYIGHLPHNPDKVYVATGYSGNGITYSHIAAITLRDIIVKGSSAYTDVFTPARVKPVAGFADFVKENVDVVKEFFTKRANKEKIKGSMTVKASPSLRMKLVQCMQ